MYRMSRCVVGVLAAVVVLVPGVVAGAGPGVGSIVVRARVEGPGAATFGYQSNLSPGGRFALDTGGAAEATFTPRAGGDPYTVKEIVPAGWVLSGVGCGITRPGGGFPHSGVSVDFGSGSVAVTLAAGDLVTCTYTNATSSGSG